MKRQLLFFDIDDTLLSGKTHSVPESAVSALARARAQGHLVFVNTGRTIRSLPDQIKGITFDGYLCGCGTRIVYEGRVLSSHSFVGQEVVRIVEAMDRFGVEGFLEGSLDVYCKRQYRQAMLNGLREDFQRLGLSREHFIEDMDFEFDKFCVLTDSETDMAGFMDAMSDTLDFIDRGHHMYEIVPKGYSKARAMEILADHLGMSMADTWAFGDSSNDLSMLQAAAHGVAMGRHDAVLDPYAEMITDTVENDGIEKALIRAGLI